jgi:hypothetical protein
VTYPATVPAGVSRYATVTYDRVHSAAIARNVLHGFTFQEDKKSDNAEAKPTRFRLIYQQAVQAHVIRDWMSSHPKIVLPIAVFLLGTLTYTV